MARGVPSGLTVKLLLPLIAEKRGNLAAVARALSEQTGASVARSTVSEAVNASPRLKAAVETAREATLDDVETAIEEKALGGDVTAQIFILKTRGRQRGYSERTEVTGADGAPLVPVIQVTLGRPDDSSSPV